MLPDYPHKLFTDKRDQFELLMETLTMRTPVGARRSLTFTPVPVA